MISEQVDEARPALFVHVGGGQAFPQRLVVALGTEELHLSGRMRAGKELMHCCADGRHILDTLRHTLKTRVRVGHDGQTTLRNS